VPAEHASGSTGSAALSEGSGYGSIVLHELWDDGENGQTFCLAGPMGNYARAMLGPHARLSWTVDAASHFEAMTRYYDHMGWHVHDRPELGRADLRRTRLGVGRETDIRICRR
jgi:hypothetical protein